MYPEVHTLADATLRWSGVEAHGSTSATKSHHILLEHPHQEINTLSTMEPDTSQTYL
jgi:hypothetical protein